MTTPTSTDWAPYLTLIQEFPLRPIQHEHEHAQAMAVADRLVGREDLAPTEVAYLQVLARLVQEYEDTHVALPPASGADVVHYLMEAHQLRQRDLAAIVGTRAKSVVSEVLSGKRRLSLNQVRRLSDYFGLPADVFIDRPTPASHGDEGDDAAS